MKREVSERWETQIKNCDENKTKKSKMRNFNAIQSKKLKKNKSKAMTNHLQSE